MVSSGRFCAGNGRGRSKPCASGPDPFSLAKRRGFGVSWARSDLFPWLRRKSGLCYTAGANSPFEAYIYVC